MDQCFSKKKHTPLPLFFQSHTYIYLDNKVVLIIMTKHLVYLGLREHNHILMLFVKCVNYLVEKKLNRETCLYPIGFYKQIAILHGK